MRLIKIISSSSTKLLFLYRFSLITTLMMALTTTVYAKSAQNVVKPDPVLATTHFDHKQVPQALPASVKKLLQKLKIPAKNISVYIRDLNAQAPLISHNANVLRTPASTIKLLTTYSALKKLGPNYSWKTEVWMRGALKDGILQGDLILKGYGDPFLVHENFWKLLKALRDKGLKHIDGNVIIDNSYFQLSRHNPADFDGKEFRVYNAPSSALMFNFQATRFLFKANETSGKVDITPLPKIKGFTFNNKVALTKGKCKRSHKRPKFYKGKNGKLTIKGKFSKKCEPKFILRSVSKPEEHVFNAFRELWSSLGGTVLGQYKIGSVTTGDTQFHVYNSSTLGHQIRLINKWSNNVMTKQLLLTLGAETFGAPATLEKGRRAVLNTLKENNIDSEFIRFSNGSGLSRTARITANQMGLLLETAFRDAYMPEFMASLAVLGVDGTLARRLRKNGLRGRSHLKTGSLDFVTAISGYMLNRNGKRLVIVIQHNGKRAGGGRGKKIQDALLRWSFEQ